MGIHYHGSIVGYKVNAAVGGGFNIVADRLTPQDKLELYTLERKLNIKKVVPAVTQQLAIRFTKLTRLLQLTLTVLLLLIAQ